MDTVQKIETVVFGGGCFWCTEAAFKALRGVTSVVPGYSGGTVQSPTYDAVCSGTTGHAEVVRVTYDPSIIAFDDLLSVFFTVHDPTTLNRQGNDVGTQYRSVIFSITEAQQAAATTFIAELTKDAVFSSPIITEVATLSSFFEAEPYHQDFYSKNSENAYCQAIINPKLKKLRERYQPLLKTP